MKILKTIILCFFFYSYNAFCNSNIDPNSKSIHDAYNAYFQMDHVTAYSIFNNVWADENQSLKDRASAGRLMAKMDWLFYQNPEKAKATISNLIQNFEYDKNKLYLLKARIHSEENNVDEAIKASKIAIELSTSDSEKYNAQIAYYRYVLEKYENTIIASKTNRSQEEIDVQEAYVELLYLANNKPGDVDLAKLHLGYSLLLKNGQEAMKGWMSFFRITKLDQIHSSLIKDPSTFKKSMLQYGSAQSNNQVTDIVIKGLAESGFYEYANLIKMYNYGADEHKDNEINDICDYFDFLRNIKIETKKYYQATIEGQADKDKYIQVLMVNSKKLWETLSWSADKPELSEDNIKDELNKRFKALVVLMDANGYFGMHMGHVILDDRRLITQHNESAEFRYIVIDHMVSNGFSSWFWDGAAEVGGWADDNEAFLQVRSAGSSQPIRSWQNVFDAVEVKKRILKIEELSIKDMEIAKSNPYAYLPGLSLRLDHSESKKMLDSLTILGLTGGELRLNYINLSENISTESSIFAHEGRHAIDKKNDFSKKSWKLEYTAKLSEIYYSSKPMLAFSNIMQRNIGDKTSHGQASLKVVKGVVKWMDKHKSEIVGFDDFLPILPQMDKLTNQQLKKAVLSMDPLVKG